MNPAQLNTKIKIYNIDTEQNIYAGSDDVDPPVLLLETYAQKLPIGNGNMFAIEAGASWLNNDCIFTIRDRKSFELKKNMYIMHGEDKYTINAFRNRDDKNVGKVYHPNNYIEIVAVNAK